ncbi:MAG: ferrous iron transport protein B [Candidatus Aminicenantes bacterium]|nr:ferrous iron transport protein B [Candidatus Aminicenantes bacterium]
MKKPEIVLVGQPNAGKSTVFNVLSDIKTATSNFSGTTVEKAESDVNIEGRAFHIVDLPGAYSLNPGDEAERVTLSYLTLKDIDLVINVVDATQLARSLELTVELIEFGIPMVIALNMWDEAERKGLKIYPEKLEKLLNIPVVATSALLGKGINNLMKACREMIYNGKRTPTRMEYTSHIEEIVTGIEAHFSTAKTGADTGLIKNGSPRFYAIKAIENPGIVPAEILAALDGDMQRVRENIARIHKKDCCETIAYERHHIAMKLTEDISHFIDRKTVPFRERLDRYLLHPYLGYLPLLIFILGFFITIYFTGELLSRLAAIPLEKIPALYQGLKSQQAFLWFTIEGIYQGVEGTLGIVLPYFLPLIFLTSLFEDTGYLARMAFLMDVFMHKIGLHGKSVAPFILGFGCTVPALYGVRIIENKRDRTLTAILLPFIPCSARTSVILAMTAALAGPLWALFIYAFVILLVGITGKLLSLFMGAPTGLVMEIPDLKIPSLRVSFNKTRSKIKQFLNFAVPFLILGSIAMGWLEYLKINDSLNRILAPVVKGVLGLPDILGSTLVFGFFRKELVLVTANSAFGVKSITQLPLSGAQVVVFAVFVTLYFPCFSTFVVMWKEFGKKVVLLSSVISIIVALIAAFVVKLILV